MQVDERTLRELYLPAFEKVVKEGHVRSIMCAYNAVNGTFCAENEKLLTEILRKQWGYEGFVVTDWGAVKNRTKGLEAGEAEAHILFGEVCPSGKLAETFPLKLSDNPSYLNFPGEEGVVQYKEDIFIGYRYYDKKQMDVAYPFGYGLSYTSFGYGELHLDKESMKDTDTLSVSCRVTNTGAVPGKETVQLYTGQKGSCVRRPIRELKGFEKVELKSGESKIVTFSLDKRSFAYYNT